MENILYQLVIPNLLFFLVILLIFLILQTVIVFFLGFLERKSHDWLMALMPKIYRHYRRVQSILGVAGLLLILGFVWVFCSILKKAEHTPEITFFAAIMLLVITLLYFILTRLRLTVSIRRRSDRALYFVLSMVLFLSILLLIEQKFPYYRRYVYKNVVIPAVAEVERTLDINKADQLLNTFRVMEQDGQCPFKDFQDGSSTNVIHNFLYVGTDAAPRKGPRLPLNPELIIKGNTCTNGTDTFIHSVTGAWYWVIDTAKN